MSQDDFSRIERIVHLLVENYREQPTLAAMAAHANLSEFHFQRLFSRWAGVSPKKFVQYLTLEHAKQCLANADTILDASYASGLSGSSRLHDLFVRHESLTPGEYRKAGAGLLMRYDFVETPFGEAVVAATDRGVCGLAFTSGDRATALAELMQRWPRADVVRDAGFLAAYANQLQRQESRSKQGSHELRMVLGGTAFQLQVWEALLRIPPGARVTYQQIADRIGSPKAVRAVANAIGRNPVAWLIPCHRVIRSSGALGGYHWGEARKAAMLGWESSRLKTSDSSQVGRSAGA